MRLFYLLLVIIIIAGVICFWQNIRANINIRRNLSLLAKEASTLSQDGITFRDLNKNCKLDPYEDPRHAFSHNPLPGNFGANDGAVLDVIFGKFEPHGRLPFELPSSMEAVRKQKEDVPHDSENPLFPFGHGLCY